MSKIFRSSLCLLILIFAPLNLWAGNISDALLEKKMQILNRRYDQSQLQCDFEIYKEILTRVHAVGVSPAGTPVELDCKLGACPQDYGTFCRQLYEDLSSYHDLHDRICFGNGLDEKTLPTISSGRYQGATFHPLLSGTSDRVYGAVMMPNQAGELFEVQLVAGPPPESDLKLWEQLSKGLFDQEKRDISIQLQNVATRERLELSLSYEQPRKYFSLHEDSFASSLALKPFYDCVSTPPWVNDLFGACITRDQRRYVWIKSWNMADPELFLAQMQTFLLESQRDELPLILDLSYNQGGNAKTMVQFLCLIGSAPCVAALQRLEIQPNPKNELLMAAASKNYFEYLGLDPRACARTPATRRWVIVTSGAEVSATEQFLYLVQQDPCHFFTIGQTTQGGSGLPLRLVLPNTQAQVDVSQIRLVDPKTGKMVIENQGVNPDQRSFFDESINFEKRALHLLRQDGIQSKPTIFKKAEAIDSFTCPPSSERSIEAL